MKDKFFFTIAREVPQIKRLGRGFSLSNLKNSKKFYLIYAPSVQQVITTEYLKSQSLADLFVISLIDIKTTEMKHQDLGQMQMYVNYFDRYVKTKIEKPSNIYASEYSLYLPDKTLLQSKLAEWIAEFEEKNILQNGDDQE